MSEFLTTPANGSVEEVAGRLVQAIEAAGAKVFARVPHSKGAASVGLELADAELVIFGNPAMGTPALQQDIRAGLALPLRVLVHDDNGQTTLTYEDVGSLFDGLNIAAEAPFRDKIKGALAKLTAAAAG